MSKPWFFQKWLKPKNKFSFENLKRQWAILKRNSVISSSNQQLVADTLRSIIELVIWSEQNGHKFFDYFLEQNMIGYFLRALLCTTQRTVRMQLLQIFNILVENIEREMAVYYILSNNHINDVIAAGVDKKDEEQVAYYISLLRSVSIRLSPATIQFFYNHQKNDFPLFFEAIRYFDHHENMIRIAVRILTLNVFRVADAKLQEHLRVRARPYFAAVAQFVGNQCRKLDTMMLKRGDKAALDDAMLDVQDSLDYFREICSLNKDPLSNSLTDELLQHFFNPVLVRGIVGESGTETPLSPRVALTALAQAFHVLRYPPLVNTVTAALFLPGATSLPSHGLPPDLLNDILREYKQLAPDSAAPSPAYTSPLKPPCVVVSILPHRDMVDVQLQVTHAHDEPGADSPDGAVLALAKEQSSNRYRDAVFSYLLGDDSSLRLSVLVLVAAMLANEGIDSHLLETAGLLPRRLRQHKHLMKKLTAASEPKTPVLTAPPPSIWSRRVHDSGVAVPMMLSASPPVPVYSPVNSPSPVRPLRKSSLDGLLQDGASEALFNDESDNEQDLATDEQTRAFLSALVYVVARSPPVRPVELHIASTIIVQLADNKSLQTEHRQALIDAYIRARDNLRPLVSEFNGSTPRLIEMAMQREPVRWEELVKDAALLAPTLSLERPTDSLNEWPEDEVNALYAAIETFACLRRLCSRLGGREAFPSNAKRFKVGGIVEHDVDAVLCRVNGRPWYVLPSAADHVCVLLAHVNEVNSVVRHVFPLAGVRISVAGRCMQIRCGVAIIDAEFGSVEAVTACANWINSASKESALRTNVRVEKMLAEDCPLPLVAPPSVPITPVAIPAPSPATPVHRTHVRRASTSTMPSVTAVEQNPLSPDPDESYVERRRPDRYSMDIS